jgi:6-pyruvoyltetrahydropterin/6-carboxytetrahydropterin synthase
LIHLAFDLEFAFGHRLLGYRGKCVNLHGHNGRLRIEISLDDPAAARFDLEAARRAARAWVDDRLDHQVLLAREDPLVRILIAAGQKVLPLDSNPSAENIARIVHEAMAALGLPVVRVEFWETPTSSSAFS